MAAPSCPFMEPAQEAPPKYETATTTSSDDFAGGLLLSLKPQIVQLVRGNPIGLCAYEMLDDKVKRFYSVNNDVVTRASLSERDKFMLRLFEKLFHIEDLLAMKDHNYVYQYFFGPKPITQTTLDLDLTRFYSRFNENIWKPNFVTQKDVARLLQLQDLTVRKLYALWTQE
jgi:hypothetical protein